MPVKQEAGPSLNPNRGPKPDLSIDSLRAGATLAPHVNVDRRAVVASTTLLSYTGIGCIT
jgi:hypothetical protein